MLILVELMFFLLESKCLLTFAVVEIADKTTKGLRKVAIIIASLWLLAQVVLLFCHLGPQGGDWGHYIALARRCFNAGQWYPMESDILRSNYIFAPGLVNLLIFEARFMGGIWANRLIYVLMNVGLMLMVADVARRLFSARVGWWTVIVYCLLYSNWFIAQSANTELPFLFLSMLGVWIVMRQRNRPVPRVALACLVAGLLIGLANWIRPLGVLYLVVVALLLVLLCAKRARWAGVGSLLCGFALMACTIGLATKARTGYFCCQSTTGGFNLIMTANDKAFGGVDTQVWADPTSSAYIANRLELNCFQRDSVWRARSVEWIAEHPVRYAWLYVKKMPILLAEDSWADQRIFPADDFYYNFHHGQYTRAEFLSRLGLKMLKSSVYYVMMVLALLAMVPLLRRRDRGAWWLTGVFVAGMLITCFLPVQPRYHYPFLWPMIVLAAWKLNGIDFKLHRNRHVLT